MIGYRMYAYSSQLAFPQNNVYVLFILFYDIVYGLSNYIFF